MRRKRKKEREREKEKKGKEERKEPTLRKGYQLKQSDFV